MFCLDRSPFAVSTKTRSSSRLPCWLGRRTRGGQPRIETHSLLSSHSHGSRSLPVSISPQSLRDAALLCGLTKLTGEISRQNCKGGSLDLTFSLADTLDRQPSVYELHGSDVTSSPNQSTAQASHLSSNKVAFKPDSPHHLSCHLLLVKALMGGGGSALVDRWSNRAKGQRGQARPVRPKTGQAKRTTVSRNSGRAANTVLFKFSHVK